MKTREILDRHGSANGWPAGTLLRLLCEFVDDQPRRVRDMLDESLRDIAAEPDAPSIPDAAATHRGWSVVPKRDFGPNGFLIRGEVVRDGFLAIDPQGRNCMPGGTWFRTVRDAKAHIDIYEAVGGDAAMFWRVSRTLTSLQRLIEGLADRCPLCGDPHAPGGLGGCPVQEAAAAAAQWDAEGAGQGGGA